MPNALLHFTLAAGRFSYHRNTTDTPEQVETPDTTGLKKCRKIHDSAKKHYILHDDTSKIRFGTIRPQVRTLSLGPNSPETVGFRGVFAFSLL